MKLLTRKLHTTSLLIRKNTNWNQLYLERPYIWYGLPKIHKQGIPLRPICSNINVPANNLCNYLTTLLKPLTEESVHNVKDPNELKTKLKNTPIDDDEVTMSFDVVSLFPNIPINHALNISYTKLDEIIDTKWDELKDTLAFCIKDTRYFK